MAAAAPTLYACAWVNPKLGDRMWARAKPPAPSSASTAPQVRDGQFTGARARLRARRLTTSGLPEYAGPACPACADTGGAGSLAANGNVQSGSMMRVIVP